MPGVRVPVMEPVPAHMRHWDQPRYGGSLFFAGELGRAGCGNPECGWAGVPSVVDGVISSWCPACSHDPDEPADVALVRSVDPLDDTLGARVRFYRNRLRALLAELDEMQSRLLRPPRREPFVQREGVERVSRNAPCPCGSGRKAKKCCYA